jgi:hypothetical protein
MPWLIDGVFVQRDQEGLIDLPVPGARPPSACNVHVVDPSRSPRGDCNDRTQAWGVLL